MLRIARVGAAVLLAAQISSASAQSSRWISLRPVIGFYFWLAIDPVSPDTLYIATTGLPGLWRSTDHGASWTNIGNDTPLQSAGLLQQVAIDAHNPAHVAVLSFNGFYQSADGGQTWSGKAFDFNVLNGFSRRFAATDDLSTIYVAAEQNCIEIFRSGCTGGGVLKTTDGARSWKHVGLDDKSIGAIALDPTNSNVVYALSVDKQLGVLYRTRDGARNWSRILSPVPADSPVHLLVDRTLPSTVYLAGSGGLWTSIDGGTTWTTLHAAAPFTQISGLAVDPADPSAIFAATPGIPPPPSPPSPPLPPPPPPPDALFGVLRSTDQGRTWMRFIDDGIPQGGAFALVVDPRRTFFYEISGVGVFQYSLPIPRRRAAGR